MPEDDPVTAAYHFFNITDRTGPVDLDVLENVVIHGYGDDRLEDARKHYDVMRRHVNGQAALGPSAKPDYTVPVGLQNMGNTCYLNSLLQYLFAIPQYRDVILNLDQYKDDVTQEGFKNKRIGGMEVTRQEAKTSQEFVHELQKLFQAMTHDPSPAVSPTWKLACLALKGEETPGRRSTVSGERPNLAKDNTSGKEVSQETIQEILNDESSPASIIESVTVLPDNGSDTTLVDEIIVTPESEDADKGEGKPEAVNDVAKGTADTRPPKEGPLTGEGLTSLTIVSAPQVPAPDRAPPPVPPRPQPNPDQQKNDSWRAEAEKAAMQHDVTEVLQDVLFKTECAIKPTSVLPDGEQNNQIKSVFYGSQKWTYLDKDTEDKDERFAQLTCALTTEPRDIYDTLHEYFDLASIELNGKDVRRFGTIMQAPPVLQLMLQRQVYDRTTKDNKLVKHHIDINETIYLDRFLHGIDGSLTEKRQKYWAAKDRHQRLSDQRDKHRLEPDFQGDDIDALAATYEFVQKLGESADDAGVATTSNDTLPDLGTDVAGDADARVDLAFEEEEWLETTKALLSKIGEKKKNKLETLEKQNSEAHEELEASLAAFNVPEHQKVRYELAAVFVHRGRGGARGGHYLIFIHDFQANVWRSYNDSYVKILENPQEEIARLDDPEVRGAPYFVVYVAADQKEQFFSPLFRSPKEGEETNDTEMKDAGTNVEPNGDVSMRDSSFVEPGEGSSASHIV